MIANFDLISKLIFGQQMVVQLFWIPTKELRLFKLFKNILRCCPVVIRISTTNKLDKLPITDHPYQLQNITVLFILKVNVLGYEVFIFLTNLPVWMQNYATR